MQKGWHFQYRGPVPRDLDPVELLRQLVAFDSTSSRSNLPIAEHLASVLESCGAAVEVGYTNAPGKANLLAQIGPPIDSGAGLVLSGHMDTVPAEEPGWHSDPFTLADSDDRWVGRGSCDMKGFLALATAAVARQAIAELTAPLCLLFTHDEEVGCLGAAAFRDTWPPDRPLPRSVVVGEPTEMRVVRMHKGHLRARITLHGIPAHSGYPHRGRSAIEPAAPILAALRGLREELETERPEHHEHFPEVPFVALNIGRIRGGSAINVIPDRCVLDVGIRLLPGMRPDDCMPRLEQAVRAVSDPETTDIETVHDSPPLLLEEDALIHRTLCRLTGQTATHSVSFGSDAGTFQQMGLECALFGPGSIEVAHKPNEFLPKAEFLRAGEILDDLIRNLCVEATA